MKKTVLILVTCMFLLCGCTFERYEIGSDISVSYITARYKNWDIEKTAAGVSLVQSFPMSSITQDVINDGAVMVYFVDEEKDRDNILPYLFPVRIAGSNEIRLQNIRFDIEKWWITIVIEWDDGKECDILENYKFKVCVISQGDKRRVR